jgi:LytTr DNA-binding domain
MAESIPMKLLEIGRVPPVMREIGLGIVYWLVFLLVLEPDNVLRALQAGHGPGIGEEAVRIIGASLLGASSAPLLFALVGRFPVQGKTCWRNAAILAGTCFLLSTALIVASCVLADWILTSEHRPFLKALREVFVANFLLLGFCIAGFMAIIHALRFFRQLRDHELAAAMEAASNGFMTQIPVRSRGQVTIIELADVDWIEAQGNYLALHVGAASHLIRESLARLEPRLDPLRFTRIHRGVIVAVDRIRDVKSRGAGDASLRLKDGTELRLSRNFRERLAAAMPA